MAILVTRPHPDDDSTAASLRARGFEVLLAPMLRFEPVAFDDEDLRYGAVIVTSANALRGIEHQLKGSKLLKLPLFAVGEHTAAAARGAGFATVISGEGAWHYSRRSARAVLEAVRAAGVEISALAIPQCCISAAVASLVRDAGATRVMAAASPDENALFEVLDRALR